MTEIGVCRNEFFAGIILPHPGVTHYQYVVPFAKGVLEKRDWFQDDLALLDSCHVSATSIAIIIWDLRYVANFVFERPSFGPQIDARAVDPDVVSDYFAPLVQSE